MLSSHIIKVEGHILKSTKRSNEITGNLHYLQIKKELKSRAISFSY